MGGAEVSIRGAKSSAVIVGPVDVSDRAARLLGIVYGNLTQLQQRPVTNELLVQLANAGIQIDPRDRNWTLDFATDQVDVSGSSITTTSVPTTPISDFDQAQNVERYSTDIHTYIATGNFKLSAIEVSAAGSVKIEIKVGTPSSETTRLVAFTSASRPIVYLDFKEEIQLTSGQRIQISRTNRENYAMDIYSTVLGFNS